ncbi:hypothetical protein BH09BAC5_BH09BAC5_20540 [soil metagenome]
MKQFFLFFFLVFLLQHVSAQHIESKILRGTVNGNISQYETIEIGIRIPEYEKHYQDFIMATSSTSHFSVPNSTLKNPYTENFLRLQFSCNGKIYNAAAFYMQDATPSELLNKYVTKQTDWPWRVRFAVPDTGEWKCLLLLGENFVQAIPKPMMIAFHCVAGNNHGFLKIGEDKRHFQFSDGNYFFVLGQNIAWADEPILIGHPVKDPIYTAGYYDVYHYLENLADDGGNYVRIVMAPWSTGIEWENCGVYMQDRAWALDSMLRIAEERGIKIQLCLDLTTGFAHDNLPADWHPYRKEFQKENMVAADLLNDSTVLKMLDNYILYVCKRWGSSASIATIELLGEQNRWEGFDNHEKNFSQFFSHINQLLKNEPGVRQSLLSTSCTNTDHPEIYRNDAISFIDMHHYDNNFKCNQKRFHYVQRYSDKLDKPFLFGEMGMIYNQADPDDIENCMDISYHNAIWSTAFSGGAGTGLYWWQWKFDEKRNANFPQLRFFLDSIAGDDIYSGTSKLWTGNGLECFYQRKGNSHVFGWVHNTSYWWGNMMQDCKDRDGKSMVLPKDDDNAEKPENRSGNKFIISGLSRNALYTIDFYSTREKGKKLDHISLKSNMFGKIEVPFPDAPDCAFEIRK